MTMYFYHMSRDGNWEPSIPFIDEAYFTDSYTLQKQWRQSHKAVKSLHCWKVATRRNHGAETVQCMATFHEESNTQANTFSLWLRQHKWKRMLHKRCTNVNVIHFTWALRLSGSTSSGCCEPVQAWFILPTQKVDQESIYDTSMISDLNLSDQPKEYELKPLKEYNPFIWWQATKVKILVFIWRWGYSHKKKTNAGVLQLLSWIKAV